MLLYTHPAMLAHATPRGHPESPARLSAVIAALKDFELDRREAPEVDPLVIQRVHPEGYLRSMGVAFMRAKDGPVSLDADTHISAGSAEAAFRAAGAVVAAVDAVLGGEDSQAFCAVRPPGHHAEPGRPMGFCIFNNVAIGALHALEAHGVQRVAIIDFDVHHGNGSQAVAEKDPRLFFASTHQSPLYPGTGAADETGADNNVLNAPLPPGADGAAWRAAFTREVLPALEAFGPELILVSAGFDAHKDDPLASMNLRDEDYAFAGRMLREVAARCCAGRIVSTLEGGYDLDALGRSVAAYLSAMRG